jgi:hypothetical protein
MLFLLTRLVLALECISNIRIIRFRELVCWWQGGPSLDRLDMDVLSHILVRACNSFSVVLVYVKVRTCQDIIMYTYVVLVPGMGSQRRIKIHPNESR